MDTRTLLGIAHIIGVAFGLGGATVSDISFMRILKKKSISRAEFNHLRVLAKLVWTGILILIFSGAGLLLNSYARTGSVALLGSPRFIAKLTMVAIVVINGLVFHFFVFPKLKRIIGKQRKLVKNVWLFAITGAISAGSWYSIVIVASLWRVDLTYAQWMGAYLIILIGGITTARLVIGRLLKQ